jgi:hypothetical protein
MPESESNVRLLRERGAMEFLGGISHGALWKLREEGQIKSIKIGRALYFDVEDLHRFVDGISEPSGSASSSETEPKGS